MAAGASESSSMKPPLQVRSTEAPRAPEAERAERTDGRPWGRRSLRQGTPRGPEDQPTRATHASGRGRTIPQAPHRPRRASGGHQAARKAEGRLAKPARTQHPRASLGCPPPRYQRVRRVRARKRSETAGLEDPRTGSTAPAPCARRSRACAPPGRRDPPEAPGSRESGIETSGRPDCGARRCDRCGTAWASRNGRVEERGRTGASRPPKGSAAGRERTVLSETGLLRAVSVREGPSGSKRSGIAPGGREVDT